METTRLCPQCQQPLAADAPSGLCPQCLLKAAVGPPPRASAVGLADDFIDIGDPAEVARKLPQFEILELLGRGGMGVVYKARQRNLDRIVALKILPPGDATSPDFVARFTREARALAKLNHPNIVNVFESGETGGLYYIIMEYVDGMNLRQLLQTRRLTPAEALAIVPKICDALEYAHEEGLVHRDIKPENLLIDKKGRVKIADFGLAKLLRREPLDMTLTLSGMALGTLRYMAPEQMDKPETVDHRADLYSLGVVIYEMLTGETPMGRFELPSQKAQVDVRLDEIVLHALEKEPARRYQHASEIRTDVENVTTKPKAAPTAPAPASGAAESSPILLLDETDRRARRQQHFFFFNGLLGVVTGFALAVVFCLLNQLALLPLAIAFGAAGAGAFYLAARVRQQWEIDYLGHSVRFENGIYTSGVLVIDGKSMAAGGIGPHTELSARILSGPGAGDRIVVKTHATLSFLRCQIFVEPKGSSPAISPQASTAVPVAPEPAQPAAPGSLPRFFHLRFFVLLLLGWGAVLALWNHGPVGVLAGATILAAIVLEAARTHALCYPSWVAKLRARSFGLRYLSFSVNLWALILVFVVFISGLFLLWEGSDQQAKFSGLTSEQFEAKYKGKEYQLIRYLSAFKEQVPAVELVTDFSGTPFSSHPSAALGWIFVGYCLLSIFFIFQQAAGEQRSMWKLNRGRWGPGFACTGIFVASALCLQFALFWMHMLNGRLQNRHAFTGPNVSFDVKATVGQASDALRQWAAENGCTIDRHRWTLDTVPKGETVARVEIFSARKDSPFDRWRMSVSGLERPFPSLNVQLTGTEKPLWTQVQITCGLGTNNMVEIGSDKQKQWDAMIESARKAIQAKAPNIDTENPAPAPPIVPGTGSSPSWPAICAVLVAGLLWALARIRFGALSTVSSSSMEKADLAMAGVMLLLGSTTPPRPPISEPTAAIPAATTVADGTVSYLDGHTSVVKAVAVSPGGRTLVSVGTDRRVIVRDLPEGKLRSFSTESAPLYCVAISPDGQRVVFGGDMHELGSIDRSKNQKSDVIHLQNQPLAIRDLMLYDGGAKLAYIGFGSAEVTFYDTVANRIVAQAKIVPGKFFANPRTMTASPDGAFVAVTSSNVEPMPNGNSHSIAPRVLSVFDTQGAERLSWQFDHYEEYANAQIVFPDARTLAVCLPSGKMQRWKLDGAGHWQPAETLHLAPARYDTCAASRDGKIIWLAQDKKITGIDSATGKSVAFIELKVGERLDKDSSFPIQQIAATNEPRTLAVALWDGKVALAKCRPISDEPPVFTATELLREVSEKYASLTSFSASGKIISVGTPADGGAASTLERTFSINLARSDYYRIEWTSKTGGSITNSGAAWFAGDGHKELLNGKVITLLNRETALAAATGVSGGAAHTVPSLFFRDPQSALQERFTNATLLPGEDLSGEPCHVVMAESQDGSKWTFWIRKKDLLLQQRHTGPSTAARRALDPETIRKIAEGTGKLLKAAGQDFSPEDLENHLEAAQQQHPTQYTSTETFEHIVVDDLMLKDDFEVAVPTPTPAPSPSAIPR